MRISLVRKHKHRQTDKETDKLTKQINNHLILDCVAKTANRKFRIMYLAPSRGFLFTAPLPPNFEHRFYSVFLYIMPSAEFLRILLLPGTKFGKGGSN